MLLLIVDDDSLFRSAIKRMLEKGGFQTVEACDGLEALNVVREVGDTLDLLITDINMPRMGGIALADSVRELRPTMPILLMTGEAVSRYESKTSYRLLHKPFRRQALLEVVRALVAAPIAEIPAVPIRLELEEQLRKAKERYEECKRTLKKAVAEKGDVPASDGSFGVHQAAIEQSVALQEYMRILKELNDHIISGGKE